MSDIAIIDIAIIGGGLRGQLPAHAPLKAVS